MLFFFLFFLTLGEIENPPIKQMPVAMLVSSLRIANFISLFCVFDFFQFSEVELPFPCPILVLCKIYLTLFPNHVELNSGDFAAILFPIQRC